MSDMQALTNRVHELSSAVDFWNAIMLWGLAVAAFAALVSVFSTRFVVVRSRQLTQAQGELSVAKDRQLQTDLKKKDLRIAELQRGAAEANKKAESERLERVKLQERVAWRTISPPDIAVIGSKLRASKGINVYIQTLAGNDEAVSFSEGIAAIVRAAGWTLLGVRAVANLDVQRFGIQIRTTHDAPTRTAARNLRRELAALGFDPTLEEVDKVFENGMSGVNISVELRPAVVRGARNKP